MAKIGWVSKLWNAGKYLWNGITKTAGLFRGLGKAYDVTQDVMGRIDHHPDRVLPHVTQGRTDTDNPFGKFSQPYFEDAPGNRDTSIGEDALWRYHGY